MRTRKVEVTGTYMRVYIHDRDCLARRSCPGSFPVSIVSIVSTAGVSGWKEIGKVPVCFALVDVDLDAARYDVGVG